MKTDTWLKELYEANYARLYSLASNRLRLYIGHTADVQDDLIRLSALAERAADGLQPVNDFSEIH